MFLFSGFYIVANINQPGNTANPSPINTPYVSASNYKVTFTETGLPSGMNWGVQVGSFYVSGNTSALSIQLPDGTYTYYVFESGISDYLYSGTISVSGTSVSQNFNFYKVSLQTNVGPGTELEIEITNSTGLSIRSVINTNENFYLPNGNYSYSLTMYNLTSCQYYQVGNGYFLVNGSGLTKSFTFNRILFSTSGLPVGVNASWEVHIYNPKNGLYADLRTYNSSLSFYLPSGNYSYTARVYETDFFGQSYAEFSQGYVNTTISSVVPNFVFKNVVFTATDVPSGSYWGIALFNFSLGMNFRFQVNSSYSKISTYIPSGKYQYQSVLFSPSYLYSPTYQNFSSTNLNATGNIVKTISFHGVYNLTFIESGLPYGCYYRVYLNLNHLPAIYLYLSSSQSVSVFVANGIYSYTVSDCEVPFSTTYRVDINNRSALVNLDFYPLEFKVSGPPSSFDWRSYLFNSSNSAMIGSSSTTSNNYTYYLLPGNYSYSFSATMYQTPNYPADDLMNATTPGKVSITDSPFTQDVSFYLIPGYYYFVLDLKFSAPSVYIYNLYLENNSGYYFSFGGVISSDVNTLTFVVQNGSYSYGLSAYYYNCISFSGNIRVNGANLVKIIDFNSLHSAFNIQFLESGLPSGSEWSVTICNISHNSTSSTINFAFVYGTVSNCLLQFTVTGPSGYVPSPESGTIIAQYGISFNMNVSFSNTQNPLGHVSSTILSNTNNIVNGMFYSNANYGGIYIMTPDPNNNLVYIVSYRNTDEISSLNLSSDSVRSVDQISSGLNALAYDSHNGMLYFDAGYLIGEISPSSNNLIVMQSQLSVYTNNLLYNPVTNLLYAYSPTTGNITVFNATTLKLTDSLKSSTTPNAGAVKSMTYIPATGNIIMTYSQSSSLGVLNVNNNSLSNIKLNFYPTSVTDDISTNTIDVFGANISVISITGVIESLNDRNYSVVKFEDLPEIVINSYFNPNNGYLYLISYNSTSYLYDYGNLMVMNGQNYSLLGSITVASDPTGLVYVPGSNVLIVASGYDGILSVVELPSHSTINTSFIIVLGSIVSAIVIVGSLTAYLVSRRSKLKSAKC